MFYFKSSKLHYSEQLHCSERLFENPKDLPESLGCWLVSLWFWLLSNSGKYSQYYFCKLPLHCETSIMMNSNVDSCKGAERGNKKEMKAKGSRARCSRKSTQSRSQRDRTEVGDKAREWKMKNKQESTLKYIQYLPRGGFTSGFLFFSHFKLLVLTGKNVLCLMAHKQSAASFPDNRGFCFQFNQENAEMTAQT